MMRRMVWFTKSDEEWVVMRSMVWFGRGNGRDEENRLVHGIGCVSMFEPLDTFP